jgi:hypothetical protein
MGSASYFEVSLGALTEFSVPANTSFISYIFPFARSDTWKDLLGFGVAESIYKAFDEKGKPRPNAKELCKGDYYARSGSKMNELALSKPQNESGETIAWLAIIDFERSPISKLPDFILRRWLGSRDIEVTMNENRQALVALVDIHHHCGTKPSPIVLCSGNQNFATMDTIELDNAAVPYILCDDILLAMIRTQVVTIDDTYLDEIYDMSIGSTFRGKQRFWYGSYHNDEIKYRVVTGFLPSKGEVKQEFLYLQAKCKSSTKPIYHQTTPIFSRDKNDPNAKFRFVRPPDSRCGCTPGQGFCSHMYGFMLLIIMIQRSEYSALEFLQCALALNIDEITSEFLDVGTLLSFE